MQQKSKDVCTVVLQDLYVPESKLTDQNKDRAYSLLEAQDRNDRESSENFLISALDRIGIKEVNSVSFKGTCKMEGQEDYCEKLVLNFDATPGQLGDFFQTLGDFEFLLFLNGLDAKRKLDNENIMSFELTLGLGFDQESQGKELGQGYFDRIPLGCFEPRDFELYDDRLIVNEVLPAEYRVKMLGWFSCDSSDTEKIEVLLYELETKKVFMLKEGERSNALNMTVDFFDYKNNSITLHDHKIDHDIKLSKKNDLDGYVQAKVSFTTNEDMEYCLFLGKPALTDSGSIITLMNVDSANRMIGVLIDDQGQKVVKNICYDK